MAYIIEYLKSPELVVAVQEYFGISYINQSATSKAAIKLNGNNDNVRENLNNDRNIHRRTLSDESSSSGTSNSEIVNGNVSQDDDELKYVIGNRFWYYLFIVGTALGDEIFYATFIPFWFWNIDSAVGRRVVFVWSSVMYVGEYCMYD